MPIKPKKRIGKHCGTGGPRYCQPPGKSGCRTSAQTDRVVLAEATCRDDDVGGTAERRASCGTVGYGAVFFGEAAAGVRTGGIFATATSTGGALSGAMAGGGIVAVARGDGAVAAGGAADATTATGCACEISLAGGDA